MIGYVISWGLNFLLINMILGIIEEVYRYDVEEHQRFLAFCMFVLPTLLELVAMLEFGKPFFGVLFPWFWMM